MRFTTRVTSLVTGQQTEQVISADNNEFPLQMFNNTSEYMSNQTDAMIIVDEFNDHTNAMVTFQSGDIMITLFITEDNI